MDFYPSAEVPLFVYYLQIKNNKNALSAIIIEISFSWSEKGSIFACYVSKNNSFYNVIVQIMIAQFIQSMPILNTESKKYNSVPKN